MCLIISIGMLYAGVHSMTLSNAFYIVNIICRLKRHPLKTFNYIWGSLWSW